MRSRRGDSCSAGPATPRAKSTQQRVADGTLADILRRVPVAAGEVYYLPAGTLHAIGAGIQLFETQQTSDLTYRHLRLEPRRQPTANRASCTSPKRSTCSITVRRAPARLRQLAFEERGLSRTLLVADRDFAVERVDVRGGEDPFATGGLPLTITTLGAHLRVDVRPGGASVVLEPWQTIVTPAACERITLVPRRRRRPRADRPPAAAASTSCAAARGEPVVRRPMSTPSSRSSRRRSARRRWV